MFNKLKLSKNQKLSAREQLTLLRSKTKTEATEAIIDADADVQTQRAKNDEVEEIVDEIEEAKEDKSIFGNPRLAALYARSESKDDVDEKLDDGKNE